MECEVMSWLSIFLQTLLFLICLSILLLKRRCCEHPRRKWYIFVLDIGKQICSGSVLHTTNLLLSIYIMSRHQMKTTTLDQCDWYFLSFLSDFSVTLPLTFFTFTYVGVKIRRLKHLEHLQTGNYFFTNGDIDFRSWAFQVILWVFIACSVRFSVFILQFTFRQSLAGLAHRVLAVIAPKPSFKTLVVMFLSPFVFNSFQLLVFDLMLKKDIDKPKDRDDPVLKKHFIFA